jgi:hypothetical protein
MKLIPLTRGKFAKVDDEDYDFLMQWKWYARLSDGNWYATRTLKGIKMHRVIMNCPEDKLVDHKFGDTLDNQKTNLRICTQEQNAQNRSKQVGNYTSRYMGVYKHTARYFSKKSQEWIIYSRWKAEMTMNNKKKSLGYFHTEEEAAIAFNTAALAHRGEFSKLNIIVTS